MAKNAELVYKLPQAIKREEGYLYYAGSDAKGDGKIAGIYRTKMSQFGSKKKDGAV